MEVRQFPPSESFRSRVSLESRKGMWTRDFDLFAKALIQFPRDKSDRLMFAPSLNRIPRLLVREARSEPARSISDSLPCLTSALMPEAQSRCSTVTWRTACDRDECWFASVASCVLISFPICNSWSTSAELVAITSVIPAIVTPCFESSHSSSGFSSGSPRRSRMSSL